MPIYEYKCPQCEKVFEEWVSSHDTGPQDCPECGTPSPHIVSNTSFVLKGGGWYVTEYGNRKSGDSAAAPAAADAGSTASASLTAPESAPPAPASSGNDAGTSVAGSGAAAGSDTPSASSSSASAA